MSTIAPSPRYPEVLTIKLGASSYGATVLEFDHELSFLPWPPGAPVAPGVRGLIRIGDAEPVPVLDLRAPGERPCRYRMLVLLGRRGRYSDFGMAVLLDALATPGDAPSPCDLVTNGQRVGRN